jgi:hypothetical protein
MTMAEIEDRLPAGFHDAELLNLSIDYVESTARIDFSLWTPSDEETEKYSAASLFLQGLQYLIIEPPLPNGGYNTDGEQYQSSVDGYVAADKPGSASVPLPATHAGKFSHSLFVFGWNASLHIAAASARLDPESLLQIEKGADAV